MAEGASRSRKYKGVNDRKRAWQLRNPWYLERLYKERKRELDLIKLSNGCAICGFDSFPEGLEYHHYNPALKKFKLGGECVCRSWVSIVKEIKKCVVLCATCHNGVTWGRLESPRPNIKIGYELEAIEKYDYKRRRRERGNNDSNRLLSDFDET